MRGDHVIYLPTIPANDALPVCRPSRSSLPPPSSFSMEFVALPNVKQYFHVFRALFIYFVLEYEINFYIIFPTLKRFKFINL